MKRKSTFEKVEQALLDMMGEEREVLTSRAQLAEAAGVGLASVARANPRLEQSERWVIERGQGRDLGSIYRLLED